MRNAVRLISAPLLLVVVTMVALIVANPAGFEQAIRGVISDGSIAVPLVNIFSLESYGWPFVRLFRVQAAFDSYLDGTLLYGAALSFVLILALAGAVVSTLLYAIMCPVLYGRYCPGNFKKYVKRTFLLNAVWVGVLYGLAFLGTLGIVATSNGQAGALELEDVVLGSQMLFFLVSTLLFFIVWVVQHVLNSYACGVTICGWSAPTEDSVERQEPDAPEHSDAAELADEQNEHKQ